MCRSRGELWLQGIKEGIQEGREAARIENAKRMLADGLLPLEKIAEYIGLSLEEVKNLQVS